MSARRKSIKFLNVVLDNSTGSYFAGQLVAGRVRLELEKSIKISGVKVNFRGESCVRCSVRTPGVPDYFNPAGFIDKDVYFNREVYVVGNLGGSEIQLPQGAQEFPFSMQLPLEIPSSFKGSKGYVQYSVTALLICTTGDPKVVTKIFTVNAIVDLNSYVGADSPVFLRKESRHGHFWSKKNGLISFVFKLDRTGFTPGERFDFIIEMNNQSSKHMTQVELRIKRRVSYHVNARGESKFTKECLISRFGPGLGPGEIKSWSGNPNHERIILPPMPPTDLGGCRIIFVQYSAQIKIVFPKFILKGSTPIIIGTIPFRSKFDEIRQSNPEPTTSLIHSICGTCADPSRFYLEGYPDLPPPTYEESCIGVGLPPAYDDVGRSSNEQHNVSNEDIYDPKFVPKYATYRI